MCILQAVLTEKRENTLQGRLSGDENLENVHPLHTSKIKTEL